MISRVRKGLETLISQLSAANWSRSTAAVPLSESRLESACPPGCTGEGQAGNLGRREIQKTQNFEL
jgi:hypothetical protein